VDGGDDSYAIVIDGQTPVQVEDDVDTLNTEPRTAMRRYELSGDVVFETPVE
jgi:hypothetical protein